MGTAETAELKTLRVWEHLVPKGKHCFPHTPVSYVSLTCYSVKYKEPQIIKMVNTGHALMKRQKDVHLPPIPRALQIKARLLIIARVTRALPNLTPSLITFSSLILFKPHWTLPFSEYKEPWPFRAQDRALWCLYPGPHSPPYPDLLI